MVIIPAFIAGVANGAAHEIKFEWKFAWLKQLRMTLSQLP